MSTFCRTRQIFIWVLILLGLNMAKAISVAQPEESGAALEAPVSSEPRIYHISLNEATQLALTNNFDIQLAKYDAWISRTEGPEAQSIYDTILEAEATYNNNQLKKSSTIVGTKSLDNDYNIGLSKKLPTGTTLDVDMENNRSWSNSAFTTNALTHESSLKLEITQELGKNFFGIQDRGDVKITYLNIEGSEYTSLDKIEQNIADVQKAYWDLVLASAKVEIQEQMLVQAKELWDRHQEKLLYGLVELPEAIAAEANYQNRANELELALNDQKAKMNVLKFLLNIGEENVEFVPIDTLDASERNQDFVDSLKTALDNRQDYKKAMTEIEAKKIKVSVKKNNLWPEINLTASLKQNGLGDHFKQAVQNITEENNPELFAGIDLTFALENREAKSQLKAAELEKAKTLINLKLLERKIATNILNQVRDCQVLKESALSKDRVAELHGRKLSEEKKRFLSGRSDTDTMIRFQEDAIEAKWEAAQAKYQYQLSVINLERKEGTLLGKYWKEEF